MGTPRFQYIQRDDGSYGWQLFGKDGGIVKITPGSTGLKRSARQRAADRAIMQDVLKEMFERQQAGRAS